MARRRFGKRGSFRGFFRKKHRSYRHKGEGMGTTLMALGGAAIYGGVRAKMSQALSPLTSKIPLGEISDEVGMLGVNLAVGRFLGRKIPILRSITKAGMLIEAARIGEAVAMGQVGLGGFGGGSAARDMTAMSFR